MPRNRTPRMTPDLRFRRTRVRKPTSKELDLMLLAGCSCLLTVMYHPVADALQSFQSGNQAQGAIASQMSRVPSQPNSFYLSLPPKREDIKEEEEEQA